MKKLVVVSPQNMSLHLEDMVFICRKLYNWKPSDNKYDDDEYDVITSGCSTAATASVSNTTIGKTKITSGKSSKGKVNLKWQKVNGAAGYVVYRSTKKGSRYTKIAEITKGSTVKYTDKTAKKGKKKLLQSSCRKSK